MVWRVEMDYRELKGKLNKDAPRSRQERQVPKRYDKGGQECTLNVTIQTQKSASRSSDSIE
jgi:hypothetical protein